MDDSLTLIDLLRQPAAWILLFGYFWPTIVAIMKRSSSCGPCFFINLCFGWTLLGWILAMILACMPTKAQVIYRDQVKRARDEFYLREAEKAQAK